MREDQPLMLSDRDIALQIKRGRIVIDPAPELARLQPVSIDVTLGASVATFDDARYRVVRPSAIPDDLTVETPIGGDGFAMRPGDFVLATTAERVRLPADICAFVHGNSTLGRLGLIIHATAGLVDPGFDGHITLEVSNIGELVIMLEPGMRIGQLTFEKTSTRCLRPYGHPALGSHYQHQRGPTPPRTVMPAEPAEAVEQVAPVVALRPAETP
jgi:dCTP deaminase